MNNTNNHNDINQRIVKKLQKYPENIAFLGIKAVELSEIFSEKTVAEQLQSLVRKKSEEGAV